MRGDFMDTDPKHTRTAWLSSPSAIRVCTNLQAGEEGGEPGENINPYADNCTKIAEVGENIKMKCQDSKGKQYSYWLYKSVPD
jgi:hypothetical protein